MRSHVELTLESFVNLDQKLSRTLEAKSASKSWSKTLCQYYENEKRRDLIEKITQNAGGKDPFAAPDKYPPEWKDLLDWPVRAAQLVQDFNDIGTAFEKCYMLEEKLPYADPNRGSIESLYARWDEKNKQGDAKYVAVLKEAENQATKLRDIKKTILTMQELESIQSVEAVNSLLRKTEDPNLPVRCAAWRQLGRISARSHFFWNDSAWCRPARSGRRRSRRRTSVSFQYWPRSALAKVLQVKDWPILYDLGEFQKPTAHPESSRIQTLSARSTLNSGKAICRITSVKEPHETQPNGLGQGLHRYEVAAEAGQAPSGRRKRREGEQRQQEESLWDLFDSYRKEPVNVERWGNGRLYREESRQNQRVDEGRIRAQQPGNPRPDP